MNVIVTPERTIYRIPNEDALTAFLDGRGYGYHLRGNVRQLLGWGKEFQAWSSCGSELPCVLSSGDLTSTRRSTVDLSEGGRPSTRMRKARQKEW